MSRAHPLLGALAAAATLASALTGCPAPAGNLGATPPPQADPLALGVVGHNGGAIKETIPPGSVPLATTKAPPLIAAATAPATSPAAALGGSLNEGLADERDLADYGYIFDDGSGMVAAGGGNMVAAGGGNIVGNAGGNMVAAGGGNYRLIAPGFALFATDDEAEIDAPQLTPDLTALTDAALRTRLRERRQALVAKARSRLAARADRQAFVDAVGQATIVADAARGTQTYRFTAALPWGRFTRQVLFVYTLDAETRMLVHGYSAVLRPRPLRPKKPFHEVRREFRLLADGGLQITYFQAKALTAKQLRRVVRWEKTVSADGQVTGSGQIRWSPLGKALAAPVREVPIALTGSEEAEALTVKENGIEASLRLPIDQPPQASTQDAGQAAPAALDLEALPIEAAPEDPAQPSTL